MCLSMTKDSDFFENEIFLPRPMIANVAKWNHVQSQPYAAGVQGQCLTRGILHFKDVKKKITAEVSMLQEIKAVTKKQPSFWYTLVP